MVLQSDSGQRENLQRSAGLLTGDFPNVCRSAPVERPALQSRLHGLLIHILGRDQQRHGAAALLELFGVAGAGIVAAIPGGLFELTFAIWLIARGFASTAPTVQRQGVVGGLINEYNQAA